MELKEYIINIRRHIHKNPEIGYETYNTQRFIKEHLLKLGYECFDVINQTGVVAKLNLNKNKTIGLRADVDALNIKEQTDLEYKSINNYMHACGHDAHSAMLLGAAKLIIENKHQLNCNITLIFQPAEEGPLPGGAIKIIGTNLLNDVNNFYALHVTNMFETGTLATKYGEFFASPDLFEGKIIGKGAHASTPHLGIDPILPTSEIALKFNELFNELNKTQDVVITTTQINSGTAKNILPSESYFAGTARSFNFETRNLLKEKMTEIISNTAIKYNANYEFNFMFAYDPVINDKNPTDYLISIAKKVMHNIVILHKKEMVGEDFSYYRKIAPISLAWLGVKKPETEFIDLHNPNFTLDEDSLIFGTNLLFNLAINYK